MQFPAFQEEIVSFQDVLNCFSMSQDIRSIDDFRRRSAAQSKEREKYRNKEEKEYLEPAKSPARFPTKRIYAPTPPLSKGQRDSKRENAEMQQNRFRSQFIHRQSEKAGGESVDPCNAAERCHYGDDFSHGVFFYTLRLRSAVVSPGMIGSLRTGPAACSPPKRGSLDRGSSRQSLCSLLQPYQSGTSER